MTVVDVLGSVDELADGMGGSVDAVTGAAIGPYRKSRLMRHGEGWCPERAACTMFLQSRDRALGILAEVTVSLALGGGKA